MLVAAAVAAWFQFGGEPLGRIVVPSPLTHDGGAGESTASDFGQLIPMPSAAEALGGEELEGDPGDIPAPPNAERITAIKRTSPVVSEELAVYLVDDLEPAAVAEHYTHAAEARGFRATLANMDPKDPTLWRAVWTQASTGGREAPSRLLTIRAKQRGDSVRVVVWLRYASGP